MQDLRGQVAVVTGGARRLGRTIALALVANGYITGTILPVDGGRLLS